MSKVDGSGTTVANTVVFGCAKSAVWFTKTSNIVEVNTPGISVGAGVVPLYIWGPAPPVDNPAVQSDAVPSKHISHPPPAVPLKNRTKIGVIATGRPSRKYLKLENAKCVPAHAAENNTSH